jgi:type VI secretion system protein ImpH
VSAPTAADTAALHELLAAVQADPSAFDFFGLLRRIDALRPSEPRTGETLRPRQEALRLGQAPELDFAPAPLESLHIRGDGTPPRLSVRFFGLLGPMGPMPLHFTEFVRERLRHHDDATLAHFLDLFHHRMLSLFYRAWAQAQPVVHQDRPASDRFQVWLGALSGGIASGTPSGPLSSQLLAFHTGWLGSRSAHPEMLVKVLSYHFGVPVRVEEHVGHWLAIDVQDRSRLGHARNRAERSAQPAAQLGVSANAGNWVWDRQFRFRLHLGPLKRCDFDTLLPGGSAWQPLQELVQLFAGRDKTWDLALELRPPDRPPSRLGREQRLGVTSWLGNRRTPGASRGLHLRPQTSFLTRQTTTRNTMNTRPGGLDG